jgi:hypothetical protein
MTVSVEGQSPQSKEVTELLDAQKSILACYRKVYSFFNEMTIQVRLFPFLTDSSYSTIYVAGMESTLSLAFRRETSCTFLERSRNVGARSSNDNQEQYSPVTRNGRQRSVHTESGSDDGIGESQYFG